MASSKHKEGEEQEGVEEPPRQNLENTKRTIHVLFGWIFKILVITILIAAITFYAIIQPRSFNFSVTETELTQFNYTNYTLQYNLALNFTVHNPSKLLKIYLDRAQCNATYQGLNFAIATLEEPWSSYLLDTKSTVPMSVVLSGKEFMKSFDVNEFEFDKGEGVFDMGLMISFDVRFRLGWFVGYDMFNNAWANCGIRVPFLNMSDDGSFTIVDVFKPTKCKVMI